MSAMSSRSASKASANSARKSSRRKRCGAPTFRRHCERSEAIQNREERLDCFVASLLAMTGVFFKDIPHETHLLPRLAVCPQGAYRRDRNRIDRQDRIHIRDRGAGHAE